MQQIIIIKIPWKPVKPIIFVILIVQERVIRWLLLLSHLSLLFAEHLINKASIFIAEMSAILTELAYIKSRKKYKLRREGF